jgi:HK97 family phage major capsid protein
MTIDEIRARQDEIRSRLQALDSEFPGTMTTEARSEWDRIEEEFETNSTTLTELEFRRERVEELAGRPENREEATGALQVQRSGVVRGDEIWDLSTIRSSVSGPQEATRELQERAKRALEQADFAHEDANREDTQAHIEKLMGRKDGQNGTVSRRIMQTGSPTYRRAFQKKLTGQELSPEEQRSMNLLGEEGAEGGFAVPYTLDPTFNLTSNGVENPVRQLADVKPITTNTWKGVNTAGTTANYDGEGDQVADGSFELSQPEIDAHRCSVFVPFSYEYGQDFGSLESELATVTQDAKDTKEASAFLTGTGEKQPFGLLVGATNTKPTATKEVLAVADLYTVKGALPPRYVPGASWLANDAQYDRIRQFDDEGGADLWVQLGDGRPANLIGKPAYEWSTMDATTAANKLIVVYGDIKRCYVIVERLGMAVKIIPDLFGENQRPTGESGFYAFWRNGAKVRDANAARVLKVAAE